jgi:aryl-alcohol dehydrogenase-like predicted oxidoreductase
MPPDGGRESKEKFMEQRSLGRSGLRVSIFGLGCNNFGRRIDLETSTRVVHKALDLGINFFDTADVYRSELGGSEEFLGKALGSHRKDVVVATKIGMAMDRSGWLKGASRRYIITAVEASLKRLNTDWIDLCQQHQPDPLTPVEETLRAFDDLIRAGKIRYIGCSNLPAWKVVEAHWTAQRSNVSPFISCQDEYSLLTRRPEREMIPMMEAHGLGLLPYYPLASGMLTGKYRRDEPLPADGRLSAHAKHYGSRFVNDKNWPVVEELAAFCEKRGRTMLELAFSWLIRQKCVSSVIAGATKPEQLEHNVRAGGWALSEDELEEIDKITIRN